MPKLRVTLSIGFAVGKHEDIIEIPQDEWDEAEDKEQLINQYWVDWSNNYIEGGAELIEE